MLQNVIIVYFIISEISKLVIMGMEISSLLYFIIYENNSLIFILEVLVCYLNLFLAWNTIIIEIYLLE